MNKKISIALFSVCALAVITPAQAQWWKFWKKKPKTEAKKPEKTPYEEILDGKRESATSSFLSLHKTDGKLYIEMPIKNLGKDVLVAATLSSISNPQIGVVGNKGSSPLHMRFFRRDSVVMLEAVNTNVSLPSNATEATKRAISDSYSNLPLFSFPISGYSKDSTTVLFDASSFFLKDSKYFRVLERYVGAYSASTNEKSDLASVRVLKAFDDNATVTVDKSYSLTLSRGRGDDEMGGGGSALSDYPITASVTYSIVRLPEERMRGRSADTRIGYFQNTKYVLDGKTGFLDETPFINRWRLEPTDEAAYLAGKLTTPKKPIIFYLDNAFPPLWKEAAREGILRWNKAFEKIGFKDAVQVRDFPKDDPTFDPDNIKYSCIRYVPVQIENAMGPSWVDPRSGEIINASVFVYADISSVVNMWRFVQTAQIDERVRTKVMPDDIMKESLAYVLGHEVGHTLGLMHNMGASFAFPTDSLRSVSFTQKYGTTPSIMDYARFNYIAQPQDKGVALSPPELGVYDYYAIEWGYKAFPNLKDKPDEEQAKLDELIAQHERDSLFHYGVQQFGESHYDPSALEEDLSDDPIRAGDYGLANLKYILQHLDQWITDDEDSQHKATLYNEMMMQGYRYLSNVYSNVPGIYLSQTSETSGLPRYKVVPKEKQKASAQWLLRQAREIGSIANEALEKKLASTGVTTLGQLASSARLMAITATSRLALSHYLDSTSYAPSEYLSDVYQNVFAKTIAGEENLTQADKELQQLYVLYLSRNLSSVAQSGKRAAFKDELKASTSFEEQLHKAYHCTHDHAVELQQTAQSSLFGTNYGIPEDLWGATVNMTADDLFSYGLRAKALLEEAITKTKDKELREYYSYLLIGLREAVKD